MTELLFDPLTRGPFWASSFLAILLAMIGCISFHAKKPLMAEVVAHCSYPGAILGLIASMVFFGNENPLFILFIALLFALIGAIFVKKVLRSLFEDSSMTLVLAGFFGLGVLFTSIVQQKFSKFYRLAQGYLFGQISTMTDTHILIYFFSFCLMLLFFLVFLPRIKLLLFDKTQSIFSKNTIAAVLVELFVCMALVLGIRGIGVVLVSSFFVAPAAFSLRFSRNLTQSIMISASLAFILNALAFFLSLNAPIGPVVVLFMSLFAFLSLKRRPYVTV